MIPAKVTIAGGGSVGPARERGQRTRIVDFLVVGLGLGALSILSGIVMVTLMVWRWERAARRATVPEERRYHVACAGSRNASGQALIVVGVVILLATIGAVAGSLDDRTGSLLVATTATVAGLGLIVRDFLYRARNPMPRRPRARTLDAPEAASPTRITPLDIAPVAAAQHNFNQEEAPEPVEATVGMAEEPALDAVLDLGAPVEIEVAAVDAVDTEPGSVQEEVEVKPVAEPVIDEVIDVPYSFMRDDDPAAGERTEPYSFMAAEDHAEDSRAAAARNGAKRDRDDEAAAAMREPGSNAPGGDTPRKAKPLLRLVGKQRAQTP
jgi:hypothetical protein